MPNSSLSHFKIDRLVFLLRIKSCCEREIRCLGHDLPLPMSSTTAINAINTYGNNSSSNNHANNASHDEDEGENNNVNANTVQSASPTLVSPALTYSSSTRTPATLSPSTPFFGSFG